MRYTLYNGPMQTTASPAKVAITASTIKTLLQLKPFVPLWVVEWGISFDGASAATPGVVDLIETDVAATVTAFVDNDITKTQQVADGVAASVGALTLSTSGSGYTATVEGSITSVRNLDGPKLIAPTNQFEKAFAIGERPMIQVAKFARIRVFFGANVNALCYMVLATTPQG
jgi:hypothetical protein